MAILSKGHTFADGDDVTSTKANNLVDQATFVSGASGTTDDSTLEVNGSGRLQVKDSGITTGKIGASAVTTAKLANSTTTTDGVTFPKMRYIADMRVIGNVSGGSTYPAEVQILDEDDMASDSATSLATQQSIKAYTAATYSYTKYSGATAYSGTTPTTYTDLNLSSIIGAQRCLVYLSIVLNASCNYVKFRTNGETETVANESDGGPVGASSGGATLSPTDKLSYVMVLTDANGVVEWTSQAAVSSVVKVLTYTNVL